MLKKNEIIPLEITAISHEGSGVGRHDGMAVFVPMTAVGDKITAKVVKAQKSHAFAIIESIDSPSAFRIEDDCPVYRRCGGCSLRHMSYENEVNVKSGWLSENLRRIAGVEITLDAVIPSPAACRYRNKAQYPVRQSKGEVKAGFFAKRSHDLIPIRDCKLAPEFFADIVRCVTGFMEDFAVPAYDEAAHSGIVRHIFIRHARATDEAMLCLILNSDKLPHSEQLVKRLCEDCPRVKTVVINENTRRTNVIFGEKTRVIAGSGYITDELCGVRVRLSAQSFYQVNREAAERLYKAALDYAAPDKTDVLLDLYCGAGTIGLSMAHTVKQVVGVDVVPAAIKDAKFNAEQNGITNARFILADAKDAAALLKSEGLSPDIIIVDPPRSGLDESLPALIADFAPKKLVYVSCDSATLSRDIARLTVLGFKLLKARAVDLFPRCAHVECLVLMVRE